MKFDVNAVFCEVISGLALAMLGAGMLDVFGVLTLKESVELAKDALGLTELVGLLLAAYVMGVVLSSFGLLLDEFLFVRWSGKIPSDHERARFYRRVPEHVLAWRDTTWAYRFCYRNLGVIALVGVLVWPVVLAKRQLWGAVVFSALVSAAACFVLFWASNVLYVLYNEITRSVGAADQGPPPTTLPSSAA